MTAADLDANPATRLYSTTALAVRAGVTYRQVDLWVRAGYLRPAWPIRGTGDPRRFLPVEVTVARVVAAMRDLGLGDMGNGKGGAVIRGVASAVREGRPFARAGRWWFTYDDTDDGLRVTLWAVAPTGDNGERP